MRLAFVSGFDVTTIGGTQRAITRIARNLYLHFGVEVDIIVTDINNAFLEESNNAIQELDPIGRGVNLYRVGSNVNHSGPEYRRLDIHNALIELCRKREYSLFQAFHASFSGFTAVYAAKEARIPAIVSIRGGDVNRDAFHPTRFGHLKWALQNANDFTAVSSEALSRARIISEQASKGRVILNSLDPTEFTDEISIASLKMTRPLIGSLGNFRVRKGIETLLLSFKRVLQRYNQANLVLIGEVIPEEQQLFNDMVLNLDLRKSVTVLGTVQKGATVSLLRELDVFVFASLNEGCPNAILEAMYAKVPIISVACGAIPALIRADIDGYLVRANAVNDIVSLVDNILTEKKQIMVNSAHERVVHLFNPRNEALSYMEVYNSL